MGAFTFNAGQSNYTGEVLEDLLTYTAQENETYKEGLIHIKSGIQKKYALPSVQLGEIIQDHVATPDSSKSKGQYVFAERYLEPNDFMIYFEFNPRDFEQYYKPFQPNGNLVFRELDPKVQATMIRLLMESKAEYINHAIWCAAKAATKAQLTAGNSKTLEIGADDAAGPMKYFDGALARLLMNNAAGSDTEDAKCGKCTIAGTGAFANGAAVEAELFAMWKALPPKVRKKQGLVILMDYNTWDMYNSFLSDKTFKYSDNRQENQHLFQGKRIIPMVALPDDTIVMGVFTTGYDSNLWMGVDYANDENVLQVEKLQANSELYFFKMLLKMDINIVRPKEVIAHIPATVGGGSNPNPAPSQDDEDEETYTQVDAADIFTEVTELYSAVADPTGQNPYEKGWYTKDGDNYEAVSDTVTTPQPDTTYYELKNPYALGWYTKSGSDYSKVGSGVTTPAEGTTYYSTNKNPKTEGWYTRSGDSEPYTFTPTNDTEPADATTYWEKDE